MSVISIRIERTTSAPPPTSPRHRTRRRAVVAAAVAAGVTLAAAGIADATSSSPTAPSVYTSLNPVTVLSGRVLHANSPVAVVVAGGATTVPAAATSVLLKVDVGGGTTKGRLDVFPNGSGAGQASVRWSTGQSVDEQLTVRVGQSRRIALKNISGKVTVTVHVLGYYAPPGSPSVFVTSPTSAQFLWNSNYPLETGPGSFTEYFTRFDDVSVPSLTQAMLRDGTLQVFMTPSPANNPDAWLPLPYQFDSSFGFTYNFTYLARPGHVVLMFYFIQTNPSATLPTLSTFAMNTYNFKIVVSPVPSGGAAVTHLQRRLAGHTHCTPIPNGRTCTVTP